MNLIRSQHKIFEVERYLKDYPQLEIEPKHIFAPGVYAREVLLPAGSCVIGKIHRTEHLNIISKGRCTVNCLGDIMEIEGPFTFVSLPGVKKAVYSHTDVIWTTIHVTKETDIEKLEEEIIMSEFELAFDPPKRLTS